jgi:hypothetical protein
MMVRDASVGGKYPKPAIATAAYVWYWRGANSEALSEQRITFAPRRCPAFNSERTSSAPGRSFGPKIASISSNKRVGGGFWELTIRYNDATVKLAKCAPFLTSGSVTSIALVLPDPGSGERNANLGVESQSSMKNVCAIHRTWATRSSAPGYETNLPTNSSTASKTSAPSKLSTVT